jgi:hypothetical protein
MDRALELMSMALKKKPGHIGILYRQALILQRKGDIKGAIRASEQSLEGAQMAGNELKEEYTKLNQELLETLREINK